MLRPKIKYFLIHLNRDALQRTDIFALADAQTYQEVEKFDPLFGFLFAGVRDGVYVCELDG